MELSFYGIDLPVLEKMYAEWRDGKSSKSALERRYLGRTAHHGKLFSKLVLEHLGIDTIHSSPRYTAIRSEVHRLSQEMLNSVIFSRPTVSILIRVRPESASSRQILRHHDGTNIRQQRPSRGREFLGLLDFALARDLSPQTETEMIRGGIDWSKTPYRGGSPGIGDFISRVQGNGVSKREFREEAFPALDLYQVDLMLQEDCLDSLSGVLTPAEYDFLEKLTYRPTDWH